MLLQFEVIVSSNIRRKKPWPRIRWIGKQKESVCLLDRKRASILYLPSGRTRRAIGAIKSHMKNVVYINTSASGEYVVALLANGQILRLHKDTNKVILLPACPDFTPINTKDTKKINLYISDDGQCILLIVDCSKINVWEQVVAVGNPADIGEWSLVDLGLGPLKSVAFKETDVHAMFFSNQIQGKCCLCTFVCNHADQLAVCHLLLRWNDEAVLHPNAPNFSSSASYHTYPFSNFNPPCKAIRIRGAFVARISHDGQTVAIAVNQRQPSQTQMLFLHPYTSTSVASDLKSMGSKSSNVLAQFAKTYWVVDMAWTSDDLFIACMTGRGSMFLLSKLGHPLLVATHTKQGIEFEPSIFLPLLPLIEHDKKKDFAQHPPVRRPGSPNSLASSMVSEKSWRQRFSVTAHPRLPILLCSDGYIVTALQITEFIRPRDVATLSLVETNRQMRKIVDKYKLEASALSTPRYDLPSILVDQAKFREHRLSRLYAKWFKPKKKTDRKPLAETQNVAEDSFTKENEDIKKLVYKFEEEEAEDENQENSAPESPDEAEDKENPKKPSGAILNADEGKIKFADLSLTFDPQSVEDSFDASTVDGKTLVECLKSCIAKICSTWGLIVSERTPESENVQSDTVRKEDELHRFFLQTITILCGVLNECQNMAHCLPWSLDEGHHHDKTEVHIQGMLCDLVTAMGEKLAALAAWSISHLQLVVETMHVVVYSLLRSHRSAPEGCSSVTELSENFSVALALLMRTENTLNCVHSYHASDPAGSGGKYHPLTQSFHALDVVSMQGLPQDGIGGRPLMLFPVWRLVSNYLTDLTKTTPSVQVDPSMQYLLSFLQRLLLRSMTQSDLSRGVVLPTVHAMLNLLTQYQLDATLQLASKSINEQFQNVRLWKGEKWQAVELLCSCMTSYFVNGEMRFVTHEPMKRAFEMERKWVTAAVRAQRLSDHWTAGRTVSLLLCSGRIREATILAMEAGDWRSAVILSAICDKIRAFTDENSSPVAMNGCQGSERSLSVLEILQERFKSLLPSSLLEEAEKDHEDAEKWMDFDPESIYGELADLFLVAVMTGSDLASWAAKFTLGHLKALCQKLSFLVDPDTYLPAPPLYLPQPTVDETKGDASSVILRQKISTLLRFTLVIFHSLGITQDASSWYIRKLEETSKSPTSSASETLPKYSEESLGSKECQTLLSAYRETCFLMWILHVREQISLHSRRYQVLREAGQDHVTSAWECLHWIGKLRPFSKFMRCEAEMQDLVLCLVASVKLDFEVVSVLASYFHTPKRIEPKVETRYKQIMSKMRKITVPAEREGSLPRDSACEAEEQNLTMQPLTVFYQRECRAHAQQAENRFFPHIFMKQRPLDGTGTSTMSLTIMSVDEDLLPSEANFVFEADRTYHQFIAQLFDIILDKSVALHKFVASRKKGKRSKLPGKLLVLGNRFQIATEELNSVADVSVSRLKRFSTRVEARGAPEFFSTPKLAVKKTASVDDLASFPARELRFSREESASQEDLAQPRALWRYFSQPEVTESGENASGDALQAGYAILEADRVPVGMQKRLQRLSSYANWLEHWSERHLPSQKRATASAMRLRVTKEQLLTGLIVAELRFGKRDYFQSTGSGSDRTSEAASERNVPESEDDVTTVSSIADENQHVADRSDAAISRAVSDHLIATDADLEGREEPDAADAIEEDFDEVDKTVVEEQEKDEEVAEEDAEGEIVPGCQTKDSTLRAEDLRDGEDSQAPESTAGASSAEPDGGGVRKPKPPTPTPAVAPSDATLAGAVRGEIQNVLLAQQVSLLSQILLGQTMIASQGGAANVGNPVLNGVLQSLVPGISLSAPQSAPAPPAAPEPRPPVEEKVLQAEEPTYPVQQGMQKSQKFAIPFFHVPGITNSQDPKQVKLQRTPGSRQAWASSTAARKTRYETETSSPPPANRMRLINLQSPGRPLLVKDLASTAPKDVLATQSQPPPRGHNSECYTHVTQNDVTDSPTAAAPPRQPPNRNPHPQAQHPHTNFLKFPSVPHREHAFTSRVPGPAASGAYRTQFPILQAHVEPLERPQFAPSLPRRAWSAETLPAPFSRVRDIPQRQGPQVRRELVPRLIDPREVLAYEGRKQGFQTVAKKPASSSRAPPVPMMKVKAPSFESGPPRDRAGPSALLREELDKENVDPDKMETTEPKKRKKMEAVKKDAKPVAAATSFDGYLDQEAINREVALMSGSDSDGMMTPADAHLVASLARKAPSKPRMKDAQMQAIVEDEEVSGDSSSRDEEPEDYRNKLTTKPLKPPPDIFLKLRLETDALAEEADTVDRTGFLHVGDVSVESVKRGLPKQQQTPAEAHYKTALELRPDVTPYAPGFPLESQPQATNVDTMLSDHVREVNKVREVREVTRERWTSAMQQMGAQLDAIDVMAKKMNDDFKSSEQLVRTIDTLGEVMAPSSSDARRSPRSRERSLSPVLELRPLTPTKKLSPRDGARRSPIKLSPRSYDEPSRDNRLEAFEPLSSRDLYRPISAPAATGLGDPYDFKTSSSRYKARLQEAYELSAAPGDVSAYSDVDDHVSSSSSSISYAVRRDRPYETPHEFPTIPEEDGAPSYTSSSIADMDDRAASVRQQELLVRDLIEDNETSSLKVKPFNQRSDEEREKIRRWMEQKRRERTGEYQDRVRALREAEAKPFKGPSGHVTQRQIEESQRRREERRRQMLESHHKQRVNDSVHLMEEIKSEKPSFPAQTSSRSRERAFAKSSKTRRSPLKEVNGHLNTTYRINKRSTPYKKKSVTKDSYRGLKTGSYSSPETADPMSDVSLSSVLSTWKLSDDVKRLLYGSMEKRNKGHVTFEIDDDGERSSSSSSRGHVSMARFDDDHEAKSCGTASLLGDVDWSDVDAMVAAVDRA